MAGLILHATTPEISTGTVLKTLFQLMAAANHRVLLHSFSISFKGTSGAATPILVEIVHQTTAGTMTGLTLIKDLDSDPETIQTTALHTATAEPTFGDLVFSRLVHPQDSYDWIWSLGRRFPLKGAARLGLRVTAAAAVNAVVDCTLEE